VKPAGEETRPENSRSQRKRKLFDNFKNSRLKKKKFLNFRKLSVTVPFLTDISEMHEEILAMINEVGFVFIT